MTIIILFQFKKKEYRLIQPLEFKKIEIKIIEYKKLF